MQLHQSKPIHKLKKRKRIGRGGKRGTYSGRGIKGQMARSGRRLKPIIRELIKKYPKLRGYRFKGMPDNIAVLNLSALKGKFEASEIVNPQALLEKRIVSRINGKTPKVKILGKGDLTKPLNFEGCDFSKSVKEKIEKSGGKIKEKIK